MDAATKTWLDELAATGSLSPEEKELLTKIGSNPKADEFIKSGTLRQADYSRKMQEVQTLTAQLAQKETDVAKFQGDLATWKAGAEGNYQKALKDKEALELKLTTATSKLSTIATLHGVPEEEWKTAAEAPVIQKPAEKNYLTVEEYDTRMKKTLGESALIDAAMHDLNVKHLELFGTPLKGGVAFMGEAMASGKTLTAFFDEKFKVVERQEALREEAIQKRIQEAVAANDTKLRSEMNLSAPRQHDRQSPLFGSEAFKPRLAADGVTKISGVEAAMAAHHASKYAPGKV